ncbi:MULTISPECIES: DUF3592 domain-containing protein [unclassified Halomonas]|uniref:DUF3592 domain-containing protein n=1 Tax=unclassified Halomonas TaxID=2609666 RepID=UPI0020A1FD5D|nr:MULTISPECIES: DUF3592 domain-containing protein [unclassified Halomonas]MCP1315815.1 DUF3592 domain-containing protein [Halomonas sp. 707D7]MCP1328492.1 DUF3592 domain-containing protein [Halomonas sp. 707D4]
MWVIKLMRIVFILVGAALLVLAVSLFQQSRAFHAKADSTEGRVVELVESRSQDSTTYRPVVTFTTDDGTRVQFTSREGSNPPRYAPGERVEVLFDPDNPRNARLDGLFDTIGAWMIVGGIGAVFLAGAVGSLLFSRFTASQNARLREQGLRLETTYQGVERNTGLSVNGRHPYRVTSQWLNPESLEVHVFKSENLWYDPSSYLETDTIPVFIEQGNPRKYHMDLSFLPRLAK